MMKVLPKRLASIDILRALTMFFMIFVNDLWSVKNIPGWLEHAGRNDDAMGFADTIFPLFLFIVGLSVPFAILARKVKGESEKTILIYILTRSLALLVMGFFHVNLESYSKTGALIPRPIWQILITVAFFLIWLDYPATLKKSGKWLLQGAGVVMLIVLALLYHGDSSRGGGTMMRPHWWGILGLIGWAYLLTAVIYLYSKERIGILIGALCFFLFFNIAWNAEWLDFLEPVKKYVWIVGDGSMPALTTAGVLVSVMYRKFVASQKTSLFWGLSMLIAIVMLAGGFALRPFWGISKIRATPSWVMICTAIGIVCFLLLIYIADIKQKANLFSVIRPAGTSTLTAYLLPYIHYAIYNILGVGIALPLALRTGIVGIVKCLLYALIIILVTGFLEKRRIRLKI